MHSSPCNMPILQVAPYHHNAPHNPSYYSKPCQQHLKPPAGLTAPHKLSSCGGHAADIAVAMPCLPHKSRAQTDPMHKCTHTSSLAATMCNWQSSSSRARPRVHAGVSALHITRSSANPSPDTLPNRCAAQWITCLDSGSHIICAAHHNKPQGWLLFSSPLILLSVDVGAPAQSTSTGEYSDSSNCHDPLKPNTLQATHVAPACRGRMASTSAAYTTFASRYTPPSPAAE